MKTLSRALSALLLICLLGSFCMWRYEKLSMLSGVVSYVNNALDRVSSLVETVKPGEGDDDTTPSAPSDPNSSFNDYQPSATVDATLRQTLYDGLLARQDTIDLSALSPSKTEVSNAMAAIIYSSPELFYLETGYSLATLGNNVQAVAPTYSCSSTELVALRGSYEAALAEIVGHLPRATILISCFTCMTTLLKTIPTITPIRCATRIRSLPKKRVCVKPICWV